MMMAATLVGSGAALLTASPHVTHAASRVATRCALFATGADDFKPTDSETLLGEFFASGGDITKISDDDEDDYELDDDNTREMLEQFMLTDEFEHFMAGEESDADDDDDSLARALVEESALSDVPPLTVTPASSSTAMLADEGVVRLGSALSADTAATLRDHVLTELDEVLHAEGSARGESTSRFSSVLAPHGTERESSDAVERRWDLRMRLSPLVRRAVCELVGGTVGDTLEATCGLDAELYELAALIAAPGAAPQPLHADTLWNADGCLFTSFVALQQVAREIGPTRFLRGTHTAKAHAAFDDACTPDAIGAYLGSEQLSGRAACGLLETGDATLYDGRLLHGGSANTCDADDGAPAAAEVRVLFYATFKRAAADAAELGNPEAYSLLSSYRGRFTLGDLRKLSEEDDWE